MRHALQTESHVGLTRAHAARAIALLQRPDKQAEGQAGRQRNAQTDRLERQSSKTTRDSARSVQRRRRRLPGLVLRRHGSSYLGVSLVRRPRVEPRRQRRGPNPREEASVSAIYRMWDAGK